LCPAQLAYRPAARGLPARFAADFAALMPSFARGTRLAESHGHLFHEAIMDTLSTMRSNAARSLRDAIGTVVTGGGPLLARPLLQRLFGARSLDVVLIGRNVLVTGASDGIGRAVARKAAGAGAHVILVARNDAKLRELAAEIERSGGRARVYAADLSMGESTRGLLTALAADGLTIDVLVNNAGRSIRRSVSDSSARLHDYERTMALNYFGSLRLILGLLPGMRARRRGHIVNVSSTGAQMSTPLFSAYVASKAALDAFSRVAAIESRADGVRFTTVYMPLVRTKMIAPTAAFADQPALSPEQAADMVLRPLVTHERQLGTLTAAIFGVAQLVAPTATERLLSLAGHMLDDAQPKSTVQSLTIHARTGTGIVCHAQPVPM
jgi:short-subunit dehydrogenase